MSGISDTDVIDLVAEDAAGDVLLVMVEVRPWLRAPTQLEQLRKKINTYAHFVLGGQLVDLYPDFRGRAVHIQLNCPQPPTKEVSDLMARFEAKLAPLGVGLRVKVLPD